ncbi:AAA family ATPase [Gordonia alkaliphila]|uniref:AAA family ATPase n=1 Tax=Gordonia alkaliphila TaxID=1053547 RepID=A0ABP8ZK11_9ACTN
MTAPLAQIPTWLREVEIALAANPQVALTGNIRDLILLPNDDPMRPPIKTVTVTEALSEALARTGHRNVIVYSLADGPEVIHEEDGAATTLVAAATNAAGTDAHRLTILRALLKAVIESDRECCLIIESASRLRTDPESISEEYHELLVAAEHGMNTAPRRRVAGHQQGLYNTVFWMLDREGDLPHWLVAGDQMRVISVPMPSHTDRHLHTRLLTNSLLPQPIPLTAELDPDTAKAVDTYASQTTGLSQRSIAEINRLAIDRGIAANDIADAIRTYRVGIPDNPWQDTALRAKLRSATAKLSGDVFGQPAAIRKSADILMRSAIGLTGAQSSSSSSRPQGVLFFAGPTGVGKTELAKSMAQLIFGRKDAFLRFDMSEFSSEHSEARLIGSPPGYIGHSAGGELTNSVRQDPFRLILFDEVEKAHPRILDKFLQILEDGRLTDGNGSTVYFSESLIVFTSNLGVYTQGPDGVRVPVVQRGADYAAVETLIRTKVAEHFTTEIGRPELLNRIGDNIVVFDFISDEVGAQLVEKVAGNVVERVREMTGTAVEFSPEARAMMTVEACKKLDFGGRGINNAMESILINPLARALFEQDPFPAAMTIEGFEHGDEGWRVIFR